MFFFLLPERSCLIRPLLLLMSTGRKSLNQEISGSGFPLAAQSMVAVRVRSTTFSCGPMSMVGKPWGIWSSGKHTHKMTKIEASAHMLELHDKLCFFGWKSGTTRFSKDQLLQMFDCGTTRGDRSVAAEMHDCKTQRWSRDHGVKSTANVNTSGLRRV